MATFKELDEKHPSLELPDLAEYAAGYVIGLLHESGLMSTNGMGPVPISWLEIDAWLRTANLDLSLWEKLTVKRLSEEYVSELLQASDKNRPAPYVPEKDDIDREAVANKILSIFRRIGKKEESNEEKELE